MSATTLDQPKPAIINASTGRDILTAAENDPALKADLTQGFLAVLANRSLLGTKTFWVTLLTPFIAFGIAYFGLGLDSDTCGKIAAGLTSVAAWVMRYVTKTSVASVLPSVT